METRLEHILTHAYKDEMIVHLAAHGEDFEEAIRLALADKQPYSWRAAWLLWSCMEENDPRIRPHIRTIIDVIPSKKDGHQRELLKILQQMEVSEEDEGYLFDLCVRIWEKINSRPSVRYHAFNTIVSIAGKHTTLFNEIKCLTEEHYMDTLSPGIKNGVYRMIEKFNY
jgi:hypothetical protein